MFCHKSILQYKTFSKASPPKNGFTDPPVNFYPDFKFLNYFWILNLDKFTFYAVIADKLQLL